ncbi:rRNA maturation RNase YbeY [Candidatus Rariloculus sp.]|uniref:rRNA maturation RNase YbeY n=1 Tax=Candidatus Rariloculus sp. TaxID=3101265 RepID=UPI003D0CB34D
MGESLSIVIQDACPSESTPPAERLRAWIGSALQNRVRGELTLRIVAEAESAELNSRYRGGLGPTNVLAFPAEPELPASADEPLPCGDLVVCAAVVAREAARQGKSAEAHWAHIVIHGALHLIGYDHESERQAKRMEDRERALLDGFSVSDPYRERP